MISWNWVKLKYNGSEDIITVVGKCQKMTKILNLINIYYVENYLINIELWRFYYLYT